jgi:hypothetical protein
MKSREGNGVPVYLLRKTLHAQGLVKLEGIFELLLNTGHIEWKFYIHIIIFGVLGKHWRKIFLGFEETLSKPERVNGEIIEIHQFNERMFRCV